MNGFHVMKKEKGAALPVDQRRVSSSFICTRTTYEAFLYIYHYDTFLFYFLFLRVQHKYIYDNSA